MKLTEVLTPRAFTVAFNVALVAVAKADPVTATGFAPATAKDWVTTAEAAYRPYSPATALMVHVPVARTVTVAPLTVHTAVVVDEKVTGPPELAVAVTAKGASFRALDARAPNVTVWATTPLTKTGPNAFSIDPLPICPDVPVPQHQIFGMTSTAQVC
jgi:hypothetical protein